MLMRSLVNLAATALMLLAIEPCVAMSPTNDPSPFNETFWTLSALPGRTLVLGWQVTLHFADGQVRGTDGCTRYSAPYTADSGSFQLSGSIVSTKMACLEPVMKQAEAFVSALVKARAARVEGGQLARSGV